MLDHDQLAQVAAQLAGRVRDDDPEANARWLSTVCPDPADWFRLAFALAAAVPADQPWKHLVAWTLTHNKPERTLRPHGTLAAVRRHGARKEPLCTACKAHEAARMRKSRADKKAAALSSPDRGQPRDSECPEVVPRSVPPNVTTPVHGEAA